MTGWMCMDVDGCGWMCVDADEPPKYGLVMHPVWGFSGELLEKALKICKNQ